MEQLQARWQMQGLQPEKFLRGSSGYPAPAIRRLNSMCSAESEITDLVSSERMTGPQFQQGRINDIWRGPATFDQQGTMNSNGLQGNLLTSLVEALSAVGHYKSVQDNYVRLDASGLTGNPQQLAGLRGGHLASGGSAFLQRETLLGCPPPQEADEAPHAFHSVAAVQLFEGLFADYPDTSMDCTPSSAAAPLAWEPRHEMPSGHHSLYRGEGTASTIASVESDSCRFGMGQLPARLPSSQFSGHAEGGGDVGASSSGVDDVWPLDRHTGRTLEDAVAIRGTLAKAMECSPSEESTIFSWMDWGEDLLSAVPTVPEDDAAAMWYSAEIAGPQADVEQAESNQLSKLWSMRAQTALQAPKSEDSPSGSGEGKLASSGPDAETAAESHRPHHRHHSSTGSSYPAGTSVHGVRAADRAAEAFLAAAARDAASAAAAAAGRRSSSATKAGVPAGRLPRSSPSPLFSGADERHPVAEGTSSPNSPTPSSSCSPLCPSQTDREAGRHESSWASPGNWAGAGGARDAVAIEKGSASLASAGDDRGQANLQGEGLAPSSTLRPRKRKSREAVWKQPQLCIPSDPKAAFWQFPTGAEGTALEHFEGSQGSQLSQVRRAGGPDITHGLPAGVSGEASAPTRTCSPKRCTSLSSSRGLVPNYLEPPSRGQVGAGGAIKPSLEEQLMDLAQEWKGQNTMRCLELASLPSVLQPSAGSGSPAQRQLEQPVAHHLPSWGDVRIAHTLDHVAFSIL